MTNEQIEHRLGELVLEERALDQEIIALIAESFERMLYAERGYESMYAWLTRYYSFSESSANRRIYAARIVRDVPTALTRIESGELNLSLLVEAQCAIQREEKKRVVSKAEKQQLLAKVECKTISKARELIATEYPQQAPPEKIRPINADQVTVTITLTKEQLEWLEKAKLAYSNTEPTATNAEVITAACKTLVTAAAKKQSATKRMLLKKSNNQCEYEHKGQRCEGKHQLEADHIIAKAKGGSDKPENQRILCRAHNQLAADHSFGRKHMQRYRESTP